MPTASQIGSIPSGEIFFSSGFPLAISFVQYEGDQPKEAYEEAAPGCVHVLLPIYSN